MAKIKGLHTRRFFAPTTRHLRSCSFPRPGTLYAIRAYPWQQHPSLGNACRRHTSQMTSTSTIHRPPNNGSATTAAGASSSSGAAGRGGEEEVGWLGYFKSIIAS